MAEVRLSESGYKRKRENICDRCGSRDLIYPQKGWIKCEYCGRLFSKKHKFVKEIE
jgi:DNA-directed RNA polymerase subunit RPC12/RpoP